MLTFSISPLKIHTEFQVKLPGEGAETQECDTSASFVPPTSFVAWAEPENEHADALSGEEQTKDLESTSDPVKNTASSDEGSDKVLLQSENTSEENNNTQGL